ncbi:PDR/VanB family oxidoreductase [Microbacterium sp. KSW2-29]|uniref:PDR/VanB family oxidoreductase n=1 Tax=Microbacterium phycohabitans TaxID=3075993 RepID=A0ABU3SLN4_9MICO|nr:PDR/VanB family oxidoreductase [Microbacterium sp. KSW2-29]MDU0345725.1 PDR/VanB family oxidoreductase [Microbacterium sp. KSW2-29]
MSAGVSFDAVVRERRDAADGVVVLDLERATGTLPHWSPGAHIDVILPDGLERQYSLCGSPTERGTWRIGVLREREGSVWLHENARVGATLRVRGPANHFLFAPTAGRSYVFVAGGIGITPIVPMVEAAEAAGATWTLLYVGRSRSTMAFVDELEARYGERVEMFAADEGRRLDLTERLGTPVARAVVYACGPARLLEALDATMAGWPRGSLHVERFEAKVLGPPVWSEPFEVDLMMSGLTVTVPPERSILDVVEENGIVVPSSCRVGTCGTCEVAVVDGEIEHRDSVLSPEEQDANRTMMPCVSRAACERITLEL